MSSGFSGMLDQLEFQEVFQLLCGRKATTMIKVDSPHGSGKVYIENGEIQHPVKNTLIGINMRDLLLRVHRIGDDVRRTFSVESPSLVIESAKITSG